MRRAALVLAAAFLLTGCGVAEKETAPTRAIVPEDLASMERKDHFGTLARGLRFNRKSSGPSNNRNAAENAIEHKETGRSLAKQGRVHGHNLTYSSYARPTALGVFELSEGVELFRSEEAASRWLKKGFDTYERYRGRTVDGVRILRLEEFGVETGEEGGGLRFTLRFLSNRLTVYMTVVAFRRGQVVANASAILRRDLMFSGDVERIADALDDQIQRVASGPAQGTPAT